MIKGKLLAIINDYHNHCPNIHVFVQSCDSNTEDAIDNFQETVDTHLFVDIKSILSNRQMKLPEGTTIRLAITCTVNYYKDYYGEYDSDMEIHTIRTLREQLPNAKLRRKWKLIEKQQTKRLSKS